ncbi:hypothetical protein PTKIN_Ptkin19aG0103200 [Pterospermum kingtungense]
MTVLGGDDTTSPESELPGDISGKLNVLLAESDDENDLSNEGLVVEEKKLEEIMQELYKEITTPSYNSSPPPTVAFPSPSYSLSFFSVSDVKGESCGASMSDSSSTVMAGIEFVVPTGKLSDVKVGLPAETGKGSPENELWVMGMGFDDNNNNNCNNVSVGGAVREEEMEGCDEGEVGDDQWLARVLKWGPLDLEEWT